MLIQLVSSALIWAYKTSLIFFVLPILLLLVWRLWRFTIRPWLRPLEPKEIPYWIPCHTVGFLRSSDKLIEHGLNLTGNNHEVFAVQTVDRKLYIVTDPQDVSAVFRDTASLGFDGYLNELLISFGFTKAAIKKIWHKPSDDDEKMISETINPERMNFIHLAEDIFKRQLLLGEKMDRIRDDIMGTLDQSLHWRQLDFCTKSYHAKGRQISLYSLCRFTMVEAATRSLFGSHLHNIDPDVVDHMLSFGDHAWQVIFRLPTFLNLDVIAPRKKLMDALRVFVQLPESQRSEQAWAIKNVLDASDSFDIDFESRACVLLLMFWAANANEHNIAFWVISHLLYDENLLELVKRETEAAWSNDTLDINYLSANCPHLEAAFNEALRCYGGAVISRKVLQKTVIGNKELQPGHAIIMPSRQLHMNESAWGYDARQFDHTRFLKNRSLDRHPAFRPFGGGVTYCPGRVLAKQQVYGLVAILFRRFDMKLAMGNNGIKPQFPGLDDTTPRLGIADPAKGMDVMVDMWEK
ncbi:unnamed protein product [Clonostachys rosea]|uniref:Cytochrome P450 n=1 Tax=Bionectria ochroleuca TaxID=29856 RepID=A0ABY6UA05_BIOOC|nr:unnamed protein product [Clonostachys rosea]